MTVRARALLFSIAGAGALSGCTLWYLATDPYGDTGSVAGGDGGNASGDGQRDTAPDGATDGPCVLGTTNDCAFCGDVCGGATPECLHQDPIFQCAEVGIDVPSGQQPGGLAAYGNQLFVIDLTGNVFACADDCSSLAPVVDGGTLTTLTTPGIAATDAGLYWTVSNGTAVDGVHHADFDGSHQKVLLPYSQAESVAAVRLRFAFTTSSGGILWADDPGALATVAPKAHQIAMLTAGTPEVAFATANGAKIGWTDGKTGHVETVFGFGDDAGGIDQQFDAGIESDGGKTLVQVGGNGDVMGLTWAEKGGNGVVAYMVNGDLDFVTAFRLNEGSNGASLFVGDTKIYWSEAKAANGGLFTILGCDVGPSCVPDVTRLVRDSHPVTQLVVTNAYIFFIDGVAGNPRVFRLPR